MKFLILVQSDADAAAIPQAASALLALKPSRCWFLVSPAVAVKTAEATAQVEKEIEALAAHSKAAAQREDYAAAQQLKLQREAKELERAKAITAAWKSLKPEEIAAKIKELMAPVRAFDAAGIATKVNRSLEHHDTADWVNMVNATMKAYEGEMPHGEYAIVWARDVAAWVGVTRKDNPAAPPVAPLEPVAKTDLDPVAQKPAQRSSARKAAPTPKPQGPYSDRELEKMPFFTLMNVAKGLNVWTDGQPKPETVKRILQAQLNKQAAAAAA